MTGTRSPLWIILLCCLLPACSRDRNEEAASTTKAPTQVAVQAAPPTIAAPCNLLTDAEVRGVVPDASSGRPDPSDAAAGIYTCVWDTPAGRVWLQAYRAGPASVDAEIRGLASGLVDPGAKRALDNVRIEALSKVGDRAMAIVEKMDRKQGIVSSNAILVTQRGEHMATLFAPELAVGDRATALRALETLGGRLAGRL